MERLVRRPLLACLEQGLRIEPQRLRPASGGVGPGEPGGRFLQQAGPAVQIPGGDGGVGALLEGEGLLVRVQGVFLAEHHLVCFAEQHPRVRVVREALCAVAGRRDRAPAIFGRAPEELGAEVVLAPTIRIEPLADLEPLRRALSRLADYRWTVFTSQNTVHVVLECLSAWGLSAHRFAQTRVAAIGPATADALGAAGVRVELVPAGYIAESLVDALATRDSLGGARVLIPRAATARDALPAGLEALGAQVDVIPVYRTVPALGDCATLRQALLAGQVDVVTFTASSIVDHFVTAVGADAARSGRFGVAAIGPVTAETARGYGMTVVVEPAQYTTAGLVEALVQYYREGGRGKGNT